MQAVVRSVLLVAAVAACGTPATGVGPDASNGGSDGPGGFVSGLSVPFASKPTVPGTIKSDLTVTSMLFRMTSLRVIGDAGPGDTRTSKDNFQIAWSEGMKPATIVFADAPSGLYSKVALLADGNLIDYSYEIYGNVKVNDVTHPYKIHDRSPLGVAIDANVTLDPGKSAVLGIRVELQPAFDTLDFSSLSNDNGTLELDTFDNQMSDFRSKMMSSGFVATHDQTD